MAHNGPSAPLELFESGAIARPDAQGVERPGPGGADDFGPLDAAELGEAGRYGPEVAQVEPGEVGRVPVTNIDAVQVARARVDAPGLPVGDDGGSSSVERARIAPSSGQVLASLRAGHGLLGEHAPFDGNGAAADGVAEPFSVGQWYPVVEALELGQRGLAWGAPGRWIRLYRG